jgi:hypothetical protein
MFVGASNRRPFVDSSSENGQSQLAWQTKLGSSPLDGIPIHIGGNRQRMLHAGVGRCLKLEFGPKDLDVRWRFHPDANFVPIDANDGQDNVFTQVHALRFSTRQYQHD